jgi:hypothetical protein
VPTLQSSRSFYKGSCGSLSCLFPLSGSPSVDLLS